MSTPPISSQPAPGPFGRRSFLEPWWKYLAGSLRPVPEGPNHHGMPVFGRQSRRLGRPVIVAAGADAADFAMLSPTDENDPFLRSAAEEGVLVLPRVEAGSETEAVLLRATGGMHRAVVPCTVAPWLDLSGGPEAVEKQRSGRTRSNMRRKARKLAALGTVEYRHVTDSVELPASLPVIFALYEARAQQVSRGPLWLGGRGRAFLSAWMSGMANEGTLDLTIMEVGGRPCAFSLVIDDPDVAYMYAMAFDPDPEIARWSPGQLLVEKMIQEAAERGRKRFDFLVGDEPYKREWTQDERAVYSLIASGRALPTWVQAAPFELRRRVHEFAHRMAPMRAAATKIRNSSVLKGSRI